MKNINNSIFKKNIICFWDHTIIEYKREYWIEPIKLNVALIVLGGFERITIGCRVVRKKPSKMQKVPKNIKILPLYYGHIPKNAMGYIKILFESFSKIIKNAKKYNIVYCRHEGIPIFYIASLVTLVLRKSLIVTIGGSTKKSFGYRFSKNYLNRIANRAKSIIFSKLDRLIVTLADLPLVSGSALNSELGGKGICFSSDSFKWNDIYNRTDTCNGSSIKWIYTGTISYEKGVDVILEALSTIRKIDKRHLLTLVGKQEKEPEWIKKTIQKNSLSDAVTYKGNVAFGHALFSIYRQSDIFVFPSLYEGMPKAPMEALSQCLPVITTKSGGGGYIIDGYNGIIVEEKKPMELVFAVKKIIENNDLRKELIKNGLATAKMNTFENQKEKVRLIIAERF